GAGRRSLTVRLRPRLFCPAGSRNWLEFSRDHNHLMRTSKNRLPAALLCLILLSLDLGCSPRDFLTRRLAADLISATDTFKAPQLFWLRTGVVSNKDFSSPDFMVLQRHGWIIGTEQKCPAGVEPPPCWDVLLTPLGVDTIGPLITSAPSDNGP